MRRTALSQAASAPARPFPAFYFYRFYPWALAVLWTLISLAACSVNPYQPMSNGFGYSEAEVGKDKYEIMYHGLADQDELTAKNYAILRAAEIGKHNGFAWFRINNEKSREKNQKEVVRETEARSINDDPYYYPYPRRAFRRRTETRTVTRTTTKPIVKIVVIYEKEECPDCLSVDAKLQEATAQGVFKD
jgi:hypothetical protein